MENNIKISVIIPIFNAEKYLENCLKSIIIQSFKEIEIICVNDGSTDNSLEILKRLQLEDKRIIIIDKKNGGSSSARNAALKIARGEYCLNIDSDDWIEQDYFKNMYKRAKKDNLDIVISDIIFDFKNKKNYILKDLKIEDKKIINGKEYIKVFFKENTYGYSWNKLIKRELYIKNNFWYDEEIFLMEDLEILMMLSYYAKRIGKLNKAYYHYIQGENNGSNEVKIARVEDIFICTNKLIEFYYKHKEFKIMNLIKQFKYIELLVKILENNYYEKKEYKEFILKFIKDLKQEKDFQFIKKLLKSKYRRIFLVKLFNILRKIDTKLGIFIINSARKIVILNKKIKNIN